MSLGAKLRETQSAWPSPWADPTFECVIRIDVETVAGVAETGDAVDVVVEVFGIPECEEPSGAVYFHCLDFPRTCLRDFLEDLEPENSVREVVGGKLRISSLKIPSAKL